MSTGPTDPRRDREPDAGHLDEDAEALEDPVHSGDAERQADDHEPEQR